MSSYWIFRGRADDVFFLNLFQLSLEFIYNLHYNSKFCISLSKFCLRVSNKFSLWDNNLNNFPVQNNIFCPRRHTSGSRRFVLNLLVVKSIRIFFNDFCSRFDILFGNFICINIFFETHQKSLKFLWGFHHFCCSFPVDIRWLPFLVNIDILVKSSTNVNSCIEYRNKILMRFRKRFTYLKIFLIQRFQSIQSLFY